jgi:hypothetical protein
MTESRTPNKNSNDLIFAVYQDTNTPNPEYLYHDLNRSYANTLDRAGRADREDGNKRRRKITFHYCRRFTKSNISDLGYADFSE